MPSITINKNTVEEDTKRLVECIQQGLITNSKLSVDVNETMLSQPSMATPIKEETAKGYQYVKMNKQLLASILKDNLTKRKIGGLQRGDLSTKRLYKAMTSGRIFERKQATGDKKYNIVLCVDVSGSMCSKKKREISYLCVGSIVKELQHLVKLSVVSYNAQITTLKRENDILNEGEIDRLVNNLYGMCTGSYSYGNHDSQAIDTCRKLLQNKEGNKLIIVLSDGMPACDHYGKCTLAGCGDRPSLERKLRDSVKECIRDGVNIDSIGILSADVSKFYPYWTVLSEIEALPKTVYSILKKHINRIRR